MEEKLELNEVKCHPSILKAAAIAMSMRMSIPNNERILAFINEWIAEIRTDIISGTKTEDEMNILLDELQRLTIKKRDTESLIGALKHAHELGKKLEEKGDIETVPISEVYGKLKKLVNKNEES